MTMGAVPSLRARLAERFRDWPQQAADRHIRERSLNPRHPGLGWRVAGRLGLPWLAGKLANLAAGSGDMCYALAYGAYQRHHFWLAMEGFRDAADHYRAEAPVRAERLRRARGAEGAATVMAGDPEKALALLEPLFIETNAAPSTDAAVDEQIKSSLIQVVEGPPSEPSQATLLGTFDDTARAFIIQRGAGRIYPQLLISTRIELRRSATREPELSAFDASGKERVVIRGGGAALLRAIATGWKPGLCGSPSQHATSTTRLICLRSERATRQGATSSAQASMRQCRSKIYADIGRAIQGYGTANGALRLLTPTVRDVPRARYTPDAATARGAQP